MTDWQRAWLLQDALLARPRMMHKGKPRIEISIILMIL